MANKKTTAKTSARRKPAPKSEPQDAPKISTEGERARDIQENGHIRRDPGTLYG